VSGEPSSRQCRHLIEGARFLEEVGGPWDDLEAGLASHLGLRLPVEVEHYGVEAPDDEECR
jgi:hypothetical protein